MEEHFENKSVLYDIDVIERFALARYKKRVALIAVWLCGFLGAVFSAVWFNSYPFIFIPSVALALVFFIFLMRKLRGYHRSDRSQIVGEIIKFHKDVKVVSETSVGGVGFGAHRKYDSYKRDEMRLAITISDGSERKITYRLKGVSDTHARYYEQKGRAMHIAGTHFPVRLDSVGDSWLCPVCGAFNSLGEKICDRCENKIII